MTVRRSRSGREEASLLKNKIFNNIGLKLLALVLAALVWWIVMNIDDPLVKKTIAGINVELRNTEALTDKGYIFQVNSGSVISITVKAPQSVANELKASDFTAYADLSQLSPLTDSASIEVECTKLDVKYDVKEITTKTQVVKLSIDNKVTQDVPVTLEVVGTPANDYVIGDTNLSQNKIQITGASAIVEQITKAVIKYDVSDTTLSVNDKMTPTFYDSNGKVVDVSDLTLSRKDLTVSIDILPTKWVGINVTPSGKVADGYKMTGYSQNIASVRIAATWSNLESITNIDLPSDAVVLNDITASKDYSVVIANYLSRSYKVVSDVRELIVHVEVEPLVVKSYTINREAIRVHNLPEGYELEILDPSVEIEISALASAHENFNLDALNTNIEMRNPEVGEYYATLIMSTSDNFEVIKTYSVLVRVTGPETEETDTDGSEDER